MPGKVLGNVPYLARAGVHVLQPIDQDCLDTVLASDRGNMYIAGNFDKNLLIDGSYSQISREFERCRRANLNQPFMLHTDFWIPRSADPNKVKYLASLIR
jgi:hypothetical protein